MTGKTHFQPPNRLLRAAAVVIIAILLAAAGALSTSPTIDAWHAVGVARDVVWSQGLAGQDWYPHGGRLARGEALLSRAGCIAGASVMLTVVCYGLVRCVIALLQLARNR